MSAPRCAAALLSGGSSSRMGKPKAELEVGGVTLGQRAAATLRALSTNVVQAGGNPIAGVDLAVVPDRRPGAGPMAGIETILSRVYVPLVVLAVDLPFVPAALLEAALRQIEAGAEICAPCWEDLWHPLCAVYSPAALAAISPRLDAAEYGMQALLRDVATAVPNEVLLGLGDPARILMNINTPEDLEKARQLLS